MSKRCIFIHGGGQMTIRKIVLFCLTSVALLVCIASTVLFYSSQWRKSSDAEMAYLEESIDQLLVTVDTVEDRLDTLYEIFTIDYVNRANTAAELVSDDTSVSNWSLTEIAEMEEVQAVNVVDENGIITDSSNPQNIGIDFHVNDRLRAFLPLIQGETEEGYVTQFDGVSLATGKRMVYIGVRRTDASHGMIQIEVLPEELQRYESVIDIKTAVEAVPTEYHAILFAVDQSSEEVIAFSQNNPHYNNYSMEKFPELSEGEKQSGIYESQTNGKTWAAVFACHNGVIYGYVSDLTALYPEIWREVGTFSGLVIVLNIILTLMLFLLIGRFILDDVTLLSERLQRFTNGHIVNFVGGRSKEFRNLNKDIALMAESIESRSARVSTMAKVLGEDFAAYEYFPNIGQEVYSENLLAMMELTSEEAHNRVVEAYQSVKPEQIDPQTGYYEEERYTAKSGRVLLIRRTILNSSSYAFIQDITDADRELQSLSENLKLSETKRYTDALTGLFNRSYVQKELEKSLKSDKPEGTLVLVDLDNFKKVNDSVGHLEGDLLLKKFAKILRSSFRTSDIVARLGGDEFVVLIQQNIPDDTLRWKLNYLVETVHEELEEYYKLYQLSVSVGAASITPKVSSFEELYQYADAAMYVAKQNGKDGFYFNQENNPCMKKECTYCRAVCSRREALFGKKEM